MSIRVRSWNSDILEFNRSLQRQHVYNIPFCSCCPPTMYPAEKRLLYFLCWLLSQFRTLSWSAPTSRGSQGSQTLRWKTRGRRTMVKERKQFGAKKIFYFKLNININYNLIALYSSKYFLDFSDRLTTYIIDDDDEEFDWNDKVYT